MSVLPSQSSPLDPPPGAAALHWREQLRRQSESEAADRYVDAEEEAMRFWGRAVGGVAISGGIYGLPAVILGAIFGFVIAAAVGMFLVVPFAVCVRMVTGGWRHPLASQCFGGLVGFVSMAPLWEAATEGEGRFLFVLGPLGATMVGQIGGYLANREYSNSEAAARQLGWRFSIRRLMAATTCVAFALAILRGVEADTPAHGIAIGAWLLWQCLLLLASTYSLRRRWAKRNPSERAVSRATAM